MKPETAKRLEAIADERHKQKEAATRRVSEQERARANNLEDFETIKDRVIKPALQEIAEIYKRKGIETQVVDRPERPNERGGTDAPSVALDMDPSSWRRDMHPEFRLTFHKDNRMLSLYTCTSSTGGPGGQVRLEDITAEWIHDEFVKYASDSVR